MSDDQGGKHPHDRIAILIADGVAKQRSDFTDQAITLINTLSNDEFKALRSIREKLPPGSPCLEKHDQYVTFCI